MIGPTKLSLARKELRAIQKELKATQEQLAEIRSRYDRMRRSLADLGWKHKQVMQIVLYDDVAINNPDYFWAVRGLSNEEIYQALAADAIGGDNE